MLGHVATSVGAALPAVSARGGKPAQFFDRGNGTWTAPSNGFVTLRMVGGGGGGNTSDQFRGGGGGGAFLQKRLAVRKGQSITGIVVGAGGSRGSEGNAENGGATVCTLPDGAQLQAGGGRAATNGSSPAAGGVASGGDVNNAGGVGGKQSTSSAAAAGSGTFGGRSGLDPSGSDTRGFTGGGPGGPNELFPINSFGGFVSQGQTNAPPSLGGGGGGAFGGTTFSQNGASGYFSLEFIPS